MSSSSALLATLLLLPASAFAGACEPNPFNETYQNDGVVQELVEGCGLESSLTSSTNLTAAAVRHYRRQQPASPLRLSFQVNLSELAGQSLVQGVSLAYGTSRNAVEGDAAAVADLFRLSVFGVLAGQVPRQLGIFAACGTCTGLFSTVNVPLSSDHPTIGIELEVGAGADGILRYWVDSDFDQAPTGTLTELDNLAWQGVDRVGLGLSTARPAFLNDFAAAVVTYSQINSSDEWLYWTGFEGPGTDQPLAAVPLQSSLTFIQGNNCSGTASLPTLASGSTALGPYDNFADVYSFTLQNPHQRRFEVSSEPPASGHLVFLCGTQTGPNAPCIGASSDNDGGISAQLEPGNYLLIVSKIQGGGCGNYTVNITGTLGD